MKIVSRKFLMALPAGTLYHTWEPCWFGPLHIKGDTCGGDFYTTSVPDFDVPELPVTVPDVHDAMNKHNKAFPVDFEGYGREGMFDNAQRYAVYERADVEAFIGKLQRCLANHQ